MDSSRPDIKARVGRLLELIESREVRTVQDAATALGCSLEALAADWSMAVKLLTRRESDYARDFALIEISQWRQELVRDHFEIHRRLKHAATTPIPDADGDKVQTLPGLEDKFVNLDVMPSLVALGKILNDELEDLQKFYGVEHKPEPEKIFIGEKDGAVHTGGDNPIPLSAVPRLLKQLEPPEELDPDEAPTAEDID